MSSPNEQTETKGGAAPNRVVPSSSPRGGGEAHDAEAQVACRSTSRQSNCLENRLLEGEYLEIADSQYPHGNASGRKRSSNKSSGKTTKRSQQQQISLPGFD